MTVLRLSRDSYYRTAGKRVDSGKGKAEICAKLIYLWSEPSSGCIAIVKSTERYAGSDGHIV